MSALEPELETIITATLKGCGHNFCLQWQREEGVWETCAHQPYRDVPFNFKETWTKKRVEDDVARLNRLAGKNVFRMIEL